VFRFQPSPVDDQPKHAADADDADIADWFATDAGPAIAQPDKAPDATAVIARQPMDGPVQPPELAP
jgi:hypothetical protein